MNIDQDKVPSNLEEAIAIMIAGMSEEDKEFVRKSDSEDGPSGCHFGLGMYLRNNWSLWDNETPLSHWFREIGITHGDDKSGIILTSLWRTLRGEPLDLEGQVKRYQDHWMRTIGKPIP